MRFKHKISTRDREVTDVHALLVTFHMHTMFLHNLLELRHPTVSQQFHVALLALST